MVKTVKIICNWEGISSHCLPVSSKRVGIINKCLYVSRQRLSNINHLELN
jgi:hypothetical protein